MELRVLRYFLTVAQVGNITKAAEELHLTQPTLSRQLAGLEEEFGKRLFIRGKRSVTLTEEGKLLRRRAEEILALVRKTEQELSASEAEISGTVFIGSAEAVSAGILPKVIASMREKYPAVRYNLVSGNADQMKEQIDMGLMDAAILLEPVDFAKYDFLRLPDVDRWGVLMPVDSPLAEKEFVTVSDLLGRQILTGQRSSIRNQLSAWFGEDYDKLDIIVTHNLIRNSARLVEQGLGYAVTVEGSVDIYSREKVCFRPLYPELTVSSVLVWKKHQTASPALRAFLEEARMLIRHDNI